MINPIPSTIEGILNSSVQFLVPKNQRPYTWSKDEALEFMEDLESYADPLAGNLFLGSLIFETSEDSEGRITIIDGQQRLTTIALLLIACRNVANRMTESNIAAQTQNKIAFVDPTTGKAKGSRLVASDSIRNIFDEMCQSDWDGDFSAKMQKGTKRQIRRVKPIYDFFESRLKNLDQSQLSRFLGAIYRTEVVRIEVRNVAEAFSIFERTNARGVDLEASDLLKNYLFAKKVEDLEEVWPQILENSDGTILRMLKYFIVAKDKLVRKPELYRRIKSYAKEVGPATLLKELDEFSRFYSAIRTANRESVQSFLESSGCTSISSDQDRLERVLIAFQALQLFKIAQVYPLVYAAISCFVRTGGGSSSSKSKKLVDLFEVLEKYHFINNVVCERVGNEVENLYADYCQEFKKSKDFDQTALALVKQLKNQLAGPKEFIPRFEDISYQPQSISLICYIFDRINNHGLAPGQRTGIFNPDPRILRKNHNIEHFYAQKPEDGSDLPPAMVEPVNNIGNLLPISFRTNSKLGNLPPEKKIEKLTGPLSKDIQNLPYVQEFIAVYGPKAKAWGQEAIADRAQCMALDAYQRIWKIE